MSQEVQIEIPREQIEEFCRHWKIVELGIFGSAARGEMRPDSDVDVLVTFAEDARWSLWDIVDMRDELSLMFDRDVDLVQRKGLKNPFRRESILRDLVVVYAA